MVAGFGIPEQIEHPEDDEVYWEFQKFLTLALKANPNVLECLYTPLVEEATGLALELREMRGDLPLAAGLPVVWGLRFLAVPQAGARPADGGQIRWKHAMHLVRLLLSGITALREGHVPVEVGEYRERLLAIGHAQAPWDDVDAWRLALQKEFDAAFAVTSLPERPDYESSKRISASRAEEPCMREIVVIAEDDRVQVLLPVVREQPYPLIFATISGAHLYGFPSPDSDFDLRGIHVLPVRAMLGLAEPLETVEVSGVREGREIDLVTHDVRKFVRLLLKPNGYVLEQVLSPLVVLTTRAHEELATLALGCVTRGHSRHYLGFAESQWRLFLKEEPHRIKPLLYVFRVLLTGIHLMRTGEVEANLSVPQRLIRASVPR